MGKGFFWEAIEAGRSLCPAGELLGWKLDKADPEQGTIRVQFYAKPEFLNPAGNVQGGFLAAMLDETFSPAVASMLGPGEFPTTLELKINFIEPAVAGVVIGEARVVKMGKSVCFLEAKLLDSSGRLVATGSATARVRRNAFGS